MDLLPGAYETVNDVTIQLLDLMTYGYFVWGYYRWKLFDAIYLAGNLAFRDKLAAFQDFKS